VDPEKAAVNYPRLHLCFGWWSLLVFLSAGIGLEALHGLKMGFYLDVGNEVRRLMWTLGHAHGTLLSLVHVAFGASTRMVPMTDSSWVRIASPCLVAASITLPGGFFLGGIKIYGGDPGLGIILVPFGAMLLVVAVFSTACWVTKWSGRS
jgi:hypothetical protein